MVVIESLMHYNVSSFLENTWFRCINLEINVIPFYCNGLGGYCVTMATVSSWNAFYTRILLKRLWPTSVLIQTSHLLFSWFLFVFPWVLNMHNHPLTTQMHTRIHTHKCFYTGIYVWVRMTRCVFVFVCVCVCWGVCVCVCPYARVCVRQVHCYLGYA